LHSARQRLNIARSEPGIPLSIRAIFSGLVAGILAGLVALAAAQAQAPQRPPVGGVGSAPDAMIFYVAKGPEGACGEGCSEWIAAEGVVQWDTHKRLINILDRQEGRKLPIVINSRGESSINVSTTLGRIIRERGISATAGPTYAKPCRGIPESECFTLKRLGGPLIGVVDVTRVHCDIACVMMLAGGVRRVLPPDAKVVLTGMNIRNRFGLNVSDERRDGLTARFGEQFRGYLRDMGVDTELLDIVEKNSELGRDTELPPADWQRLKLVNSSAL
jgi:hypothetical protein